ncbi:MAG TPA: M28 family metallopeptidase [Thermoanaerobaculia bacterium]|nr:M28 family metallopeptidase [Thermoanaerobaculia bacterium]
MKRTALALILLAFCASGSPAAEIPAEVDRAIESIETEDIRSHMRFLADDLLEGRAAGTRGYDLAAAYVRAHMMEMGLEPGGEAGAWTQQVPLIRATAKSEQTTFAIRDRRQTTNLVPLDDYLLQPDPRDEISEVDAAVVFAGFGIDAPDLDWNDYQSIDAHGKIVVILSGAPTQFPTTMRAHYGSSRTKAETAVAHGAVGLLTIRGPQAQARSSWDRMRRSSERPLLRWAGHDGTIGRHHPQLRVTGSISPAATPRLFARSGRKLAHVYALETNARRPLAFPLRLDASIRIVSSHERIESANVAGMLRGSDPRLRDEVVVYSAHLDHTGIGSPVDGDSINNGAFDNASGIAAMLESARAFSSLSTPPRRSILFLAVTAEEQGLLGSDYFAAYPTVPRQQIVANVNLDMFIMILPFTEVQVHGYDHSTLARHVDEAAAHFGIKRIDDPQPEEASFVRSDQYSFVRKGIPGIAINEGIASDDPAVEGERRITEWLRTRYHRPSDDLNQPIDWEAGRDFARYSFLVGYLIAQNEETPRWNEGDFFGERFGR